MSIFVSHATPDRAFAEALTAELESSGIRCWIAPRDVAPGADYGASIINAIDSAQLFALVFSEAADASKHVLREVDRAITLGKPLLPVKIDSWAATGGMDYRLSTVQWIEATGPSASHKAARSIARALQELEPADPPVGRERAGEGAEDTQATRAPAYMAGIDAQVRSILIQVAGEGLPFAIAVRRSKRLGASREDVVAMAESLVVAHLLSFPSPLEDGTRLGLT